MHKTPRYILIVDDNAIDREVYRRYLAQHGMEEFTFSEVTTGAEGLAACKERTPDCLLLDYSLPDMDGVTFLTELGSITRPIPIVMLTGQGSEQVAVQALKGGAQDYLVKNDISRETLTRAVFHAMEKVAMILKIEEQRQELEKKNRELLSLSLRDPLTGLYNRRGFMTLGEQALKMAQRSGKRMLLFYVDLDNMKEINDVFGHYRGDKALLKTAKILGRTFRESDILARIGGDEFVALVVDTRSDSEEVVSKRFQKQLDEWNSNNWSTFSLSFSVGRTWFDPKNPQPIEAVIEAADRDMYKEKKKKKGVEGGQLEDDG